MSRITRGHKAAAFTVSLIIICHLFGSARARCAKISGTGAMRHWTRPARRAYCILHRGRPWNMIQLYIYSRPVQRSSLIYWISRTIQLALVQLFPVRQLISLRLLNRAGLLGFYIYVCVYARARQRESKRDGCRRRESLSNWVWDYRERKARIWPCFVCVHCVQYMYKSWDKWLICRWRGVSLIGVVDNLSTARLLLITHHRLISFAQYTYTRLYIPA